MDPQELYWTKVSAIGQAAGAIATSLAVATSLYVAFRGRRPRIKLTVGERLIIGQPPQANVAVLAFTIVNAGERPVHIQGIGWRTGYLRKGPEFLRRQVAVQTAGGVALGKEPPYELQPGASQTTYALLENVLSWTAKKKGKPFLTRIVPISGPRQTRIEGYVYTADGYTFRVAAEALLAKKLAEAEFKPAAG